MDDEGLAQTRRTTGSCGTESNARETWDVDICSPEGVLKQRHEAGGISAKFVFKNIGEKEVV